MPRAHAAEETEKRGGRDRQEVRQPAALQHRHLQLRHAGRTEPHGARGRRLRRLRRQDRRGHHPRGADPDHPRAGGQGPNLLPIGFLRQLIGFYDDSCSVPAALSRDEHGELHQAAGPDALSTCRARSAVFPDDRFDEMTRQNMTLFTPRRRQHVPPVQQRTG